MADGDLDPPHVSELCSRLGTDCALRDNVQVVQSKSDIYFFGKMNLHKVVVLIVGEEQQRMSSIGSEAEVHGGREHSAQVVELQVSSVERHRRVLVDVYFAVDTGVDIRECTSTVCLADSEVFVALGAVLTEVWGAVGVAGGTDGVLLIRSSQDLVKVQGIVVDENVANAADEATVRRTESSGTSRRDSLLSSQHDTSFQHCSIPNLHENMRGIYSNPNLSIRQFNQQVMPVTVV